MGGYCGNMVGRGRGQSGYKIWCSRFVCTWAHHEQRGQICLHGCQLCSRKWREEWLVSRGWSRRSLPGGWHLLDDGRSAQQVLRAATVHLIQPLNIVAATVPLCSHIGFDAVGQHTGPSSQPEGQTRWTAFAHRIRHMRSERLAPHAQNLRQKSFYRWKSGLRARGRKEMSTSFRRFLQTRENVTKWHACHAKPRCNLFRHLETG